MLWKCKWVLLLRFYSLSHGLTRCTEGFQLAGIIKCYKEYFDSDEDMIPIDGIKLTAYTFEENTWDLDIAEDFIPVLGPCKFQPLTLPLSSHSFLL
jgi:hypothetical protein